MNECLSLRSSAFDRRAIPAGAAESWWNAPDGWPIRRLDWPREDGCRGSLLFFPGRGDFYEKYLEALDHWHGNGWCVTAADWRGQAGSGRLGRDALTGHIEDFATWVDDLAALWSAWKSATPGPHALVAHSMGGHIVLRALAEGRIDPDAVVLSAPMLGIGPQIVPLPVLHAIARLAAALGDPRRPAWKWNETPGLPPPARRELLTHDAERYADELWWRTARPELAMGPPSWRWMERAFASTRRLERRGALEAVSQPVLMLATRQDRLVAFRPIVRAARRVPRGDLVVFGSEARHELLRESDPVRLRALAAIDAFLARNS